MHEIEYFQTVPWNTITVTLYPYENVLWNPIEYSVGNLYPTEYSVGKKNPIECSIGYSVWH